MVQTITTTEFGAFLSLQKETPYPSAETPHFPPGNCQFIFFLFGLASSGHFMCIELYSIWFFGPGFFHLVCFQGLSML